MNFSVLPNHDNQENSWWNRPLWGEKSLFNTSEIAEEAILSHNQAWEQARQLSVITQAIDNPKFEDSEFLFFVKIKNNFDQGKGEYQGLNESLKLFRVSIEAKKSFLSIEEIELLHRSSKQQDFYKFVFELLAKNRRINSIEFYQKTHEKLAETLPLIKTEHGKKALDSYVKILDSLAKQDELGLRLLYLFKKNQFTDYSLLKKVSDIVFLLAVKNWKNLDKLAQIVQDNYIIFDKLGKMIGIHGEKNQPKTYGRMLQYMALRHKHQATYLQFEKLLEMLQHWQKCYDIILEIRKQYSFLEYKHPQEFKQKIPGILVYKKYKDYLT